MTVFWGKVMITYCTFMILYKKIYLNQKKRKATTPIYTIKSNNNGLILRYREIGVRIIKSGTTTPSGEAKNKVRGIAIARAMHTVLKKAFGDISSLSCLITVSCGIERTILYYNI